MSSCLRYTPDSNGYFAGQSGYGYCSIARFIDAAADINSGQRTMESVRTEGVLALAEDTMAVTAILEAGRMSLDNGSIPIFIDLDANGQPISLRVES